MQRLLTKGWAVAFVLFAGTVVRADDAFDVREELRLLRQQNQQLQQRVDKQDQLIDSLTRKVSEFEGTGQSTQPSETSKPFSLGRIIVSGEAGVAFFETGSEGQFPNAEFRVDEAKLFLDAQVFDNVYFFTELNITEHENGDEDLRVGELYLDFEEISRLWNQGRMLNARIGRFDVPFGEEYITRDAIDNPLITHSLTDTWGVDEGVELYGSRGKFDYVFAVQDGGIPTLNDYDSDKAIIGRIGYTPTKWLRVSASAMRTGDLDAMNDGVSALWFGNGFIRALGAGATKFHAELYEGDVTVRFARGHVKAFGGYVHSDDNDPGADDERDVYYYTVEGLYNVTAQWYAAARFSQILAHNGYPIVGNGDFVDYFYNELTKQIWRLSLGGGYRWSPNLVLKIEYMFERGEEVDGTARNQEDLFGVEVAGRF